MLEPLCWWRTEIPVMAVDLLCQRKRAQSNDTLCIGKPACETDRATVPCTRCGGGALFVR